MGVDYSISYGYGIAFDEDELPELLRNLDPYDEVDEWLEESGFDSIGYDLGGNAWSGPRVSFFYIKGTQAIHLDHSSQGGIHDLGRVDVLTEYNHKQITDLCNQLSYGGRPGWKVIGNVS